MTAIAAIEVHPRTFALAAPFAVAKRTAYEACNVVVRVVSVEGTVGLGAAVPVEYVTGETVESVTHALSAIAGEFTGLGIDRLSPMLQMADDLLSDSPAARAGLEMALYDIWARHWKIPLWQHFGAAQIELTSDITIPIVAAQVAAESAQQATLSGFAHLKIKVGDPSGVDADLARIAAVAAAAPRAYVRIDANQAFDPKSALTFIREALRICPRIEIVEQPTDAADLEALCEVRRGLAGSTALYADESATTVGRAAELIRMRAVDGVNVKIMKSGIVGALNIASLCRANGIDCMLGCMLESRLPLTAACAIASGTGLFAHVDLDSHHLLSPSSLFHGGFRDSGPTLTPSRVGPGWGVTFDCANGNNTADSIVH